MDQAITVQSRTVKDVRLHSGNPGRAATDEAAVLLNSSLGEGFVQRSDLEEVLTGGGTLIRACDADGRLLGVATARLLDQAAVYKIHERLRSVGVERTLAGNLVGELKSSAVAPEARGRGIGSAMVRARLHFLESMGCRYAVSASWASNGTQSSLGVLARAGFEQVAAIPGYWAAEQAEAGYLCGDCGASCQCAAVIMFYRFGG